MIISLQNTLQSIMKGLKIKKNSCKKDIISVMALPTLTFVTSKHLLKFVDNLLADLN